MRESMRQIRSAIGATVVSPALPTAAEELQYDESVEQQAAGMHLRTRDLLIRQQSQFANAFVHI